jgi:hypothetical protein
LDSCGHRGEEAMRTEIDQLKYDNFHMNSIILKLDKMIIDKDAHIAELEATLKKIRVIRKDYSYDYMLVIKTICDEVLERGKP